MTAFQHQCILAALGLYPHKEIDGIWGEKSRSAADSLRRRMGLEHGIMDEAGEEAALKALREGLPPQPPAPFWDTVRYFQREEFRCRCGGRYCDGFPAEPDETLVRLAEDVRAHFGRPAIPSSGLRCENHNRLEGGVENSRHLTGKALDFRVEAITGDDVLAFVKEDPRVRYAYRIGRGPYIHMDVE